jgi:bifunctional UDP-N-acetylglucosamine pyrophosphorylase/glucosamine-1-phosphate N-acetyltransferase
MLAGVTVVDPASTWVDAGVEIGKDARIEPGTSLLGATAIGPRTVVGPHTTVLDCEVGTEAVVVRSHVEGSKIGDGASVGPFAYLRPGTVMEAGSKAGASVEIKNSHIGKGAKVPHLSYVGDADIGAGSNLGAGTITANYDGFRKNRTTVGRDVRIGVDTMLIAPVEVGDSAYTGAGAVIKDDVPEGALAVSENAQRNIDGYAADKAAKMREEQDT